MVETGPVSKPIAAGPALVGVAVEWEKYYMVKFLYMLWKGLNLNSVKSHKA